MNRSLIKIVYETLAKRSKDFNYYDFPKRLSSLQMDNPSEKQINEDYSIMCSHFRHPVFQNFVPTYDEKKKDIYSAWYKRYLSTKYGCKID